MNEFTVAYLNMLYGDSSEYANYVPQSDRVSSVAEALQGLGVPLDVVCLSEVERLHTGEILGEHVAQSVTKRDGFWKSHARENEYIGMFGNKVDSVKFIDIGYGKQAALTTVKLGDSELAVAGAHPRYGFFNTFERRDHIQIPLAHMEDTPLVYMADWNETEQLGVARRYLKAHGLESVFDQLVGSRKVTVPTEEYRRQLPFMRKLAVASTLWRRGFNVDDIYVRGLKVVDAGVFEARSDHFGVWATLRQ